MSQSASSPLIVVLNGPNLNMLGLRQPHIYGSDTLDDVEVLCAETAEALGLAIDFRQTNGEGELVTWVQECRGRAAGTLHDLRPPIRADGDRSLQRHGDVDHHVADREDAGRSNPRLSHV